MEIFCFIGLLVSLFLGCVFAVAAAMLSSQISELVDDGEFWE